MRDAGPNRISRQYYFGAMWMSILSILPWISDLLIFDVFLLLTRLLLALLLSLTMLTT
jgi:hypothetical protein